jgi:hypothetical protein
LVGVRLGKMLGGASGLGVSTVAVRAEIRCVFVCPFAVMLLLDRYVGEREEDGRKRKKAIMPRAVRSA